MQVVNSGARVQIPPSPFLDILSALNDLKKDIKKVLTKKRKNDRIIKLVERKKFETTEFDKKIKKLLTKANNCDKI